MYMSLIHTCNLLGVNPFDYPVAIQRYSPVMLKDPSQWMPWNFKEVITSL
jgi:hypothetical protein